MGNIFNKSKNSKNKVFNHDLHSTHNIDVDDTNDIESGKHRDALSKLTKRHITVKHKNDILLTDSD